MAAGINHSLRLKRTRRHPLWLAILACYSILLGNITTIPQFYYVLCTFHLVTIGPKQQSTRTDLVHVYLEWRQQLSKGGPRYSGRCSRACILTWLALHRHKHWSLTKSLSENLYFSKDQLSTGQMKEGEVILPFFLLMVFPSVDHRVAIRSIV